MFEHLIIRVSMRLRDPCNKAKDKNSWTTVPINKNGDFNPCYFFPDWVVFLQNCSIRSDETGCQMFIQKTGILYVSVT